jgi:hypothetical protein
MPITRDPATAANRGTHRPMDRPRCRETRRPPFDDVATLRAIAPISSAALPDSGPTASARSVRARRRS